MCFFEKNQQNMQNKGPQKGKLITLAGCIEISRNKLISSNFFWGPYLFFLRNFVKQNMKHTR